MRGLPEEDEPPPPRETRRDWLVDASLVGFALAFGAITLADSIHHGLDGPLLALDAIAGVALSLALWWRRRWPFGLALASIPIVGFSSFAGPAGVVALFTVATYCR